MGKSNTLMFTNNQSEQHNFQVSTEALKSFGTNKYGNTPNNSYGESENSYIYMNDKFHYNGLPSGISVCSNVFPKIGPGFDEDDDDGNSSR